MEKRTVPAFASFRPKQTALLPERHTIPRDEDRVGYDEPRHGKHKSHRHRRSSHERHRERKEHHHRRDSEYGRPQGHRQDRPRGSTPPVVRDEFKESEYFLIDRRGDSKNVEYGGLHRYDVPNYLRIGYGRVIGADSHARIDREVSAGKGIGFRFDREMIGRSDRPLAKKNLKVHGRSQKLILPRAEDEQEPPLLETDFIALRPSLKRKRGSESPDRDTREVDYRSIEGQAKPNSQPQDEDLEFESSSEDRYDRTSDGKTTARQAALSRAVKADPANADAWLDLAEQQAALAFPDIALADLTSSQRRSVAELRLSVLEEALKNISLGRTGHDRLLLSYITEGAKIWEPTRRSREWRDALRKEPTSLILWAEYLSSLQTSHATFRYDMCRDAYLECLESLRSLSGPMAQGTSSEIGQTTVYVLLRFTLFARDAGYDELSIAIWQAVLEYYLFATAEHPGQSKLEAFEDFWESDVPRVGEDGAHGWSEFGSDSKPAARKTTQHTVAPADGRTPFASFALAESQAALNFHLPAGNTDEDEDSQDPFRFVMFSDIKPVLKRLPEHLDAKLLIDAFLRFMNLPPADFQSDTSNIWQAEPFLRQTVPVNPRDVARRYDSFSLFHGAFPNHTPKDAGPFVTSILAALVKTLPDYEELGEYLLAVLCHTNPQETTKTAKRLLKSRSTSLRYYNAYALCAVHTSESEEGLAKATQIWTKALELSLSLSEGARDEAILLWHSWAMTLIHSGKDGAALQVLLIVPDGSPAALGSPGAAVSAGSVLRARRHFEEGLDRMLLKQKLRHVALHGDYLAWLLYLSADHDVDAALQSFGKTAARVENLSSTRALELIHQAKARLIGQHMSAKRPFRPMLFRHELAQSRRLFPENSFILDTYQEVAKLTRLDDRLRDALSEASTSSSHPPQGTVSWLFAIDAEIARCSRDGASATKDSVRALFRRALLVPDSGVKSSLLLWEKWFDFESLPLRSLSAQTGKQREEALRRAREVFFDGMRFLPWSKRRLVNGMTRFAESGEMAEEELRQIHDVLVDRELRVRVDVEDAAT